MIKAFQYACSTCFILLFAFNGIAQTEKGSKLLGGSASIQFYKPFSVNLNPNAGFFVLDKLAIGSSIYFSFSTDKYTRHSSVGFAPFARYYLGKSKLQYFVQAATGIYRNWYTTSYPLQEKTKQFSYYWNASAGLGAVYFITQQVGLESTLNYQLYNISSGRRNNDNLFLNFGFQIYLPSGKE
jgi:hypothetical protein